MKYHHLVVYVIIVSCISIPSLASELVEFPWEIDEDEYNRFALFNRPVYVSGGVQIASEFRSDLDLSGTKKDDILELESSTSLQLLYPISGHATLFLEAEVQYHNDIMTETGSHWKKWVWERVSHWVAFHDLFNSGLSFQLGRQAFEDERQWWWDSELDSLRLQYDTDIFHFEIAAAQELLRADNELDDIDPEIEDVFRLLLHAAFEVDDPFRIDLFSLFHRDNSETHLLESLIKPEHEDERDSELLWYGIRLSGVVETGEDSSLCYWLDFAGLDGDETIFEYEETDDGYIEVVDVITRGVTGWGADLGITYKTGILSNMNFTLGYAMGSGDRSPEEGNDKNFRQTGLNEGDSRYLYYGELLQPDLSNLEIITVAVGFEPFEDAAIDFVYHNYHQVHPADFMWESELEIDPNGESDDIGCEWDAIITLKTFDNLEIELTGAFFEAGDAFGSHSGKNAYRITFEFNYIF